MSRLHFTIGLTICFAIGSFACGEGDTPPTDGGGGTDGGNTGFDAGMMCGDFMCTAMECSTGSCTPDCGAMCTAGGSCGDGDCGGGETCSSCPADCQTGCGDGCCLLGENCMNCTADCATVEGCDPTACGNMQCNYGLSETCLNCPDCFGLCDCGDDTCDGPTETTANCPWDCP